MPPTRRLLECILQGTRDWARLTVANRAEINFAQGDHFGRRAADENFVRNVELIPRDRFLEDRITKVPSECNQAVARDAFQNRRFRYGIDHLIADQENV